MSKGYALCPIDWAKDKNIKNELGLLLVISSLCFEQGFCWASNKYLAQELGETEINISRKIKKLQKQGYIDISYKKRGTAITTREIRPLTKMLTTINKNVNGTVNKNVKHNNISINNINNNNNIGNRFYSDNVIDFEQYYVNL